MTPAKQFSSVAQLCPTLCDSMNRSTPGLPVHHQLPEFTQTHVRWVGDAILPSHPLSSPSPPALDLSQHQGLFKWVSSLHTPIQNKKFKRKGQPIGGFTWCIVKLIPIAQLIITRLYSLCVYLYTYTHTNRDKALRQNFFTTQARVCHQQSMTCN